ncbi:uncharacterized protein LY89DRAFT_735383 [Mollisia scopiformis]|uniref:Uncharacterized protein n=1 Tax=Mollisia scopiformis TaxID=149040 RepID=A0A194X5B0_MOLSC|nr:uncharacterized protein LY89DRAFT_735383 [Mollisia scopiformis]KUJ15254.1 hypothetical protein LY89DRAFT_735383 [Mollisia scopiformis]
MASQTHPKSSSSSSSSSKPHSHSHKSHSSSSSSSSSSTSSQKQYYLITDLPLRSSTDFPAAEEVIDLHAESWKLPYSIDDEDLTFDGKPLNMLYEENRWEAEHHVDYHYSSSCSSTSSAKSSSEHKSRGRSRQSKK